MGDYRLHRIVKHRVALDLATLLHFIEGLVAFCDEGATGNSSADHCKVTIKLGSDSVEFKSPAEFGTFIRAFPEWQTPDSLEISVHHMGHISMGKDNQTRFVRVDFDLERTSVHVSGDDLFWTHQAMPRLLDQISQYAAPNMMYFVRNWALELAIPVVISLLALLRVPPPLIFFAILISIILAAFWNAVSASSRFKRRWNPKNLIVLR